MSIFGIILVILALSFLVETLVEFIFGEPFAKWLPEWSWALKYIAVIVAVGFAFFYQLDLIYLLAEFADASWQPFSTVAWPGMLISGIGIGKGSNYLHDFFKRFFVKVSGVEDLPE